MSKETLVLVAVLALHTVTQPDELGGLTSHPRGSVFEVEESELERLQRCGAVRKATKDEVKAAQKGGTIDVSESATGGRGYAEISSRAAAVDEEAGDVADEVGDEGKPDAGKAAASKTAGKK